MQELTIDNMNHLFKLIVLTTFISATLADNDDVNFRCDNGFLEKCVGGKQCTNWIRGTQEDMREFRRELEEDIRELENDIRQKPAKAEKYRDEMTLKRNRLNKCVEGAGGASGNAASGSSSSTSTSSGTNSRSSADRQTSGGSASGNVNSKEIMGLAALLSISATMLTV
jgi:Sec-independent protein translocase protein TatA